MALTQDNGLIFAGTAFIRNRRVDGAGFIEVGNVTELKIKAETETKERVSKQKRSYGQSLDSITSPKPTTISYASDTFNRENLARALMGVDTTLTKEAETITDEVVTIGKQGQWYPLANSNIDAASPLTVKTNTDTAVDAALVEVDADAGMIRIKEGSTTVPDGSTVKVSYKTRKVSGFQIAAGSVSQWELEIRVVGENRVNGKKGTLTIPRATVGADSELDWFGDDFLSASFSGNLVKDGNKDLYTFTETD